MLDTIVAIFNFLRGLFDLLTEEQKKAIFRKIAEIMAEFFGDFYDEIFGAFYDSASGRA